MIEKILAIIAGITIISLIMALLAVFLPNLRED